MRIVEVTPNHREGGRNLPDAASRIALTFDAPVAAEEEVGGWLDWEPVEIVPIVDGRWRWAQRNELEFVLARPLPAGSRFTLEVSSQFREKTGLAVDGGREFEFSTRRLALVQWRQGKQDEEGAEIEFRFNQPVDPQVFAEQASFVEEGSNAQLDWKPLSMAPDDLIRARVEIPKSRRLVARLSGALTGRDGTLGLGEAREIPIGLKGFFHTQPCWAVYPGLERINTVRLRFSRMLDRSQPTPRLELLPELPDAAVSVSGDAITVTGAFKPGRDYSVTLASDVLADDGQTVAAGEKFHFEVKDRPSKIRFPRPLGVLGREGNLLLDVNFANLKAVELAATRIYDNNLVHFFGGDERWHGRDRMARFGKVVLVRKNYALTGEPNEARTAALDLRALLKEPVGAYRIDAYVAGRHWPESTAVIAVTDLALTTKRHRDGVAVWVTSLSTGLPVEGAEVAAMSAANQTLATAVTDERGIACLATPENHPDGRPWLIHASRGSDLSWRQLDREDWMFPDADLAGREIPANYDVFVYPERGICRPGDVVHLTGIVREADGGVPEPFPLEVAVIRPDGKKIDTLIATPKPDAQGVFQVEYKIWEGGRTGRYRFKVGLPGDEETLGSTSVSAEMFVPARIEVAAEAEAGEAAPAVAVSARYLFGRPAAGLAVKLGGAFAHRPFKSAAFPGFEFGGDDLVPQTMEPLAGRLDGEGKARFDLAERKPFGTPGIWAGSLRATVTETGGRSTTAPVEIVWDTANRHVGIRPPAGMVKPGATSDFGLVVVDGSDASVGGAEVRFVLERVVRDWTLREIEGRRVWRKSEERYPVKEWTAALGSGVTNVGVRPEVPGEHWLAATDLESGSITRIAFLATDAIAVGPKRPMASSSSAPNEAEEDAFGEGSPIRLDLALDRESYRPGAEATLFVRSPIAGRGLVAVETDEVVHLESRDFTAGTNVVKLPVSKTIRGSAFVTATVVRAVDAAADWKPSRAKGIARLRIDHDVQWLELEIRAPERARPGETTPVTVALADWKPGRAGMVHLWAVDEGILQVSGFETPDPFGHFFADRGMAVMSGDTYASLLPDHRRAADVERIGAGAGLAMRMRVSPVKDNRQPPAVVWRDAVPLREDGTAAFELNLPDITGELRLMAVAVSEDSYGATERALTLATPLLIEPSLPRFAAPADRFEIPVKLFNTTDRTLDVALDVRIDGPLELSEAEPPSARLNAGAMETIWLQAKAANLGAAEIFFTATAGDERAEARETLAVRPAATLGFEARSFSVEAGGELSIGRPEKFLPLGTRAVVTVGSSPLTDLRTVVDRLIHYPYGCLEQTTSRLFTLLHAPELLEGARGERAGDFLRAGVERLRQMQTPEGGFGYWPGDVEPHLWGTLYATEFLLAASEKGVAFDDTMLDASREYLRRQLYHRSPEPDLQARICHDLALLGRPEVGRMAALGDRPDRLDRGGRAHLAGAWLAVGRRDLALRALPEDTIDLPAERTSSGRLTSDIAQDAALLEVLLRLNPKHEWVAGLSKRIDRARVNGVWGSTLDNAAALAALVRHQLTFAGKPADFTGTVFGGGARDVAFSSGAPLVHEFEWGGGPLRIFTKGEGRVFVSVTTEGLLKAEETKELDQGLEVRREWLTETGERLWGETLAGRRDDASKEGSNAAPIDAFAPVKLKVGDLIHVNVTVRSRGRAVDNLAIVDALPGGLEIENPRLTPGGREDRSRGALPPRAEFLDDRALLFVSAGPDAREYRYALRVVSPGSFALPPIQASSMYDAELASVHGAGRVEVAR